MNYLFVLRGAPGAGKSSFVREHNLAPYTLSLDEFRLALQSPQLRPDGTYTINQAVTKQAAALFMTCLENRMKNGEFICIDATSAGRELREYAKLAKQYAYSLWCVQFDMPLETCLIQNRQRPEYKQVPPDVIERIYQTIDETPVPKRYTVIRPEEFAGRIRELLPVHDLNAFRKLHFYGDIHGCATVLKAEFSDIYSPDEAYIFVGDYFDRGKDSGGVFRILESYLDKPNVFLCKGNHDEGLCNDIRGIETSYPDHQITLASFKAHGITKGELRAFYKALRPVFYFSYHGRKIVVTHGGVSRLPSVFMPARTMIHGTGEYVDMKETMDSFTARHPDWIQVFGHRNIQLDPVLVTSSCFNLCDRIEYGRNLRTLTLDYTSGALQIIPRCVRNDWDVDLDNPRIVKNMTEKDPARLVELSPGSAALTAYRQNPYIWEKQFGILSSFNYTPDAFYGKRWDAITMKARGIFFNTATGAVAARSYDKFFLLGERPESELDSILKTYGDTFTIYRKEDGYLGIFSVYNDEFLYASKSQLSGYGPGSLYADHFKELLQPAILDADGLKERLRGYSLVFEVCDSAFDRHPVLYDTPHLVLLDCIKNTADGCHTLSYESLQELAGYFSARVIVKKKMYMLPTVSLPSILPILQNEKGIEGYVIESGDRNHRFKLKTYEYLTEKACRSLYGAIKPAQSREEIADRYGYLPAENQDEIYRFAQTLPADGDFYTHYDAWKAGE